VLQYTAQVLSNLVNYRSFGFTKIIPRVSKEKFAAVVEASPNAANALPLWEELKGHLYEADPEACLSIGKRNAGHVSNYYEGEPMSDEEVAAVQAAAEKLGVDVLNTRYVRCMYVCPLVLNETMFQCP
jgi:dipeptidyl-peptidase-3